MNCLFQNILIIILFTSCNNSTTNTVDAINSDSALSNTVLKTDFTIDSSYQTNKKDTLTKIVFPEFTFAIHKLIVEDNPYDFSMIVNDTLVFIADYGSPFQGSLMEVLSQNLTAVTVEQCYETSISIMDEGPHCDLINWKHYTSPWKQLKVDSAGRFIADKYTEAESQQFPNVSIDQLRIALKDQCGKAWVEKLKNTKSIHDYPSWVGISRYFIRIKGKLNGSTLTKIIIIENPMGC